jgi:hypothetical protein
LVLLQEGHHGSFEIARSPRLALRDSLGPERLRQRELLRFARETAD